MRERLAQGARGRGPLEVHPVAHPVLSILARYLPEPQALVDRGVKPAQFYLFYDSYTAYLPGGDADGGMATPFAAAACTDEIAMRIVTPARAVDALFSRHGYLTRLYTALSPKDMTIDPVFSSNRDLPEVPLLHSATITTPCVGEPWLATDLGFETQYVSGLPPSLNLPASLRVELVRDAGPPELVQDNSAAIAAALGPVDHGRATAATATGGADHGGCGCTVGRRSVRSNVAMLLASCVVALGVRSLRRRRS